MRLGVVTGLLSFALLLVASRLFRHEDEPAPRIAVRAHDTMVDLWVGEFESGVKGVFASPWNQREWDAASDATLHAARGAALPTDLMLYDCWLFNVTDRAVTVPLGAGSLVVSPKDGTPLPLVSLASWLAPVDGRPAPTSGAAAVLRALGADRERVELPPGRMARHPVALARRVSLDAVASVARADGTPFRLRRMREADWAALTQSPSRSELENL